LPLCASKHLHCDPLPPLKVLLDLQNLYTLLEFVNRADNKDYGQLGRRQRRQKLGVASLDLAFAQDAETEPTLTKEVHKLNISKRHRGCPVQRCE